MTLNPARLAILGVAFVAAILLAFVLRNIALPHRPAPVVVAAPAAPPAMRVLVAARDLNTGDRLNPADMTWQPWPGENVSPSYITDGAVQPAPSGAAKLIKTAGAAAANIVSGGGPAIQALTGAVVREPMVKGEPILKDKIVRAGDAGYMSVVLSPGMRAIAVPVSAENGAGGFIQPGDRIDLIATATDPSQKNGATISQNVLSNARVLAVDQTTTPAPNGKSIIGSTLTLEVPNSLVDLVAAAKAHGGLIVALRSYADTGGGAGAGDSGQSRGVRLIRGGEVSEVMVNQ